MSTSFLMLDTVFSYNLATILFFHYLFSLYQQLYIIYLYINYIVLKYSVMNFFFQPNINHFCSYIHIKSSTYPSCPVVYIVSISTWMSLQTPVTFHTSVIAPRFQQEHGILNIDCSFFGISHRLN
jgi:hypothetical protein